MSSKLYLTAVVLVSFLAAGCSRSTPSDAEQHAAKLDEATSQNSTADGSTPGAATKSMPEGCYLRAVIDGQKWEATAMTPDRTHASIIPVNGKKGDSFITFTIGGMRENIGKPRDLSDANTITYFDGNEKFWGGKSGQVTVQKMDDQFIEGTFNFTAEKDGANVTCTNGEFRIPSPTRPLTN
jgi:hypothetical protein